MPDPIAYLNGRFLPFTEAALPLHDAGFVSGATVVDNARTFNHKPFRWADHLARFRRDCRDCYVPLESTDEQVSAVASELVERNARLLPPGGELQLVTFATPGPLGFYLGNPANGPGTFGMVTYPLPFARYRRFFTDGVTLAAAGVQSSDSNDLLPPAVKHRSRLVWHVAERVVNDPSSSGYHPGAVPVVLSPHGVGDTAIGSILAVRGQSVIAPVPRTVLDSISAQVVRELCKGLRLTCMDSSLDLRSFEEGRDLAPITELLLVGSGFCVAGAKRFVNGSHGRDFEWPGPVYRKVIAAWSELVNVDIEQQFTKP